ncbi:uncharacterized protein LOC115880160 [Sitophilus oryzae]|uniref:Uncharacterized protein LOC115880160 n=1 Tax=Sitophilus oryzae TaxID=7048 RepID=A0A6J2XNQ3_SITOR|nr:uncharacterized protein LOC115880160 [Sitophilus oryzae]
MSKKPPNVTNNANPYSASYSSNSETPMDEIKLNVSHSENNLENSKNIKKKILNKVKSWSSKDLHQNNLGNSETDSAKLNQSEVIESNDLSSSLVNARDSLDNLIKADKIMTKTKTDPCLLHQNSQRMAESPKSSPQLNEKWCAGTSKGSYWSQYDKQNKKNRKESKKKNMILKNFEVPRNESHSMPTEGNRTPFKKTNTSKSNEEENASYNEDASMIEEEQTYKYKYFPQNSKSVVFTNEVLVVYFNNEDVVEESKEPLKKEVDQQERNKEMRRIHLNKTQEKYNLCLF